MGSLPTKWCTASELLNVLMLLILTNVPLRAQDYRGCFQVTRLIRHQLAVVGSKAVAIGADRDGQKV